MPSAPFWKRRSFWILILVYSVSIGALFLTASFTLPDKLILKTYTAKKGATNTTPPPLIGTITKIDGNKLTIKDGGGKIGTYEIIDRAAIYTQEEGVAKTSINLNLLKANQKVVLTLKEGFSDKVKGISIFNE